VRSPFSIPFGAKGLTGDWSPYKLLDRTTLLATVARLTRKWRAVRADVWARTPCDNEYSMVRSQSKLYWQSRVKESLRHPDIRLRVSSMDAGEAFKLAHKHLQRRLRVTEEAVKEKNLPPLHLQHLRALIVALKDWHYSPDRVSILATCELARGSSPPERPPRIEQRWVGGVPRPFAIKEEIPPSKMWDKAKSAKERFDALADDAPFKSTLVSRFEGRMSRLVGVRPQGFVVPGGHPLRYLATVRPDLLKYVGPSACIVNGGWETSRGTLETMMEPIACSGNYSDIKLAIRAAAPALKLGRLPMPSIRAIDCVLVNGRANPGVVSSHIGQNRKQAFAACAEIAKFHYRECSKRFVPDLSLWSCGGREKPAMGAQPGDELKSRLVLMPETPSSLLESTFAQPFTAMLKKVKGDICIGRVLTASGFKEVVNPLREYDHVKALDWSGFDSRVTERLIVASFGIMRACFYGDDEALDNIFLRFLSHFLVKRVVTPGGWVYTISKGVPSGSPFTSIVDSLVNWIVLVDLEVSFGGFLGPKKNCRRVYGDDFLQGWAADAPTQAEFIAAARSRWGFVAKEEAAYEGSLWCTDTQRSLPFLSYRFPNGLPARPIQDALKIGLCPKKAANSLASQFRRIVYLDHFPPYDHEVLTYHREYFLWIQKQMPGMWYQDGSPNSDIITPFLVKGMVDYVSEDFGAGTVMLGDWLRQENPRRWPERWCPRRVATVCGKPQWHSGKLTSAVAHLKWFDFG